MPLPNECFGHRWASRLAGLRSYCAAPVCAAAPAGSAHFALLCGPGTAARRGRIQREASEYSSFRFDGQLPPLPVHLLPMQNPDGKTSVLIPSYRKCIRAVRLAKELGGPGADPVGDVVSRPAHSLLEVLGYRASSGGRRREIGAGALGQKQIPSTMASGRAAVGACYGKARLRLRRGACGTRPYSCLPPRVEGPTTRLYAASSPKCPPDCPAGDDADHAAMHEKRK